MRIYLKREDLSHTGAHKINNCIGQVLLARRMGKTRIIAETGAGQHGVATATACALFGLPCEVYMGAEDVERQALNVFRMKLLGAKVHAVKTGTRTLKDAMNEALRDWVTNVRDTHYVIGSVAGPHPYPTLVRELQAVIGREARAQIQEARGAAARRAASPASAAARTRWACSTPSSPTRRCSSTASRRRATGIDTGRHAATLARGRVGVLHGASSYVLCDDDGQICRGALDLRRARLPGRRARARVPQGDGPRAATSSVTDDEALGGLRAAGAHRGDPVRARDRARDRGAAARWRRDAARRRGRSSSASRAAATRTWGRIAQAPRGDAVSRPRRRCFARARAEKRAGAGRLPDRRRSRRRDQPAPHARPPPRPAPTSSSSACPGAIPRPTARRSRPRCSARSRRGGGLRRALALCARCAPPAPTSGLVLFGYANPIVVMGPDVFALQGARRRRRRRAVRRLPPDEDRELTTALGARGARLHPAARADLDAAARRRWRSQAAGGFVYYVSLTGITGTGAGRSRRAARAGRRHPRARRRQAAGRGRLRHPDARAPRAPWPASPTASSSAAPRSRSSSAAAAGKRDPGPRAGRLRPLAARGGRRARPDFRGTASFLLGAIFRFGYRPGPGGVPHETPAH